MLLSDVSSRSFYQVFAGIGLLLGGLFCQLAQASEAKPLFSIRPLAILYAELTNQQLDESQVLLSASSNVHDYQFSIADLKRIQSASTFYWLGAEAEPKLAKLAANYPNSAWVSLQQQTHAWLGMQQQLALIDSLATQLAQQAPSQAEQIMQRKMRLVAELQTQYQNAAAQFSRDTQVVLLHSAFAQWLRDLSLPEPLYISQSSSHGHHHQGEKQNLSVQQRLANGEVACVVEEPDMQLTQLKRKFPKLGFIKLSPMAAQAELAPGEWLQYWHRNTMALKTCI